MLVHVLDKKIYHSPEDLLQDFERDDINFFYFKFLFPSNITENSEKPIYKMNFLMSIYSYLYPEAKKYWIYEQINTHWHLFLSRRQMERLLHKSN